MKQHLKIYFGLGAVAVIGSIFYFALRPDHVHTESDDHDHETVAEKKETSDDEGKGGVIMKEVHLNEAQYKTTGLVLGGFEKKNLSEVINANGYTKLPPQNQAQVSVQLPGTIKTIKVMEGQPVTAGQVLATMQSMAFNNLRLDREKITQELTASQINLEYLKLEFARQKDLAEENVNARKVFQKISSDLQMEEAKIKTLQNQINILSQNIAIGGNASSPIINITAPISGNISDVNVTIGAAAEVGKPIFSIVDNSKMHVDLLVYEKDLFKVKPGQPVRFILTNQGNQEIKGRIFSVGKSFENETKSVAVHADILNEKQMLIPGMYVNALIDVGSNTVDVLPLDAIIRAEGREFIFVLEEVKKTTADTEYHFQRIEVKTGTSQLGYVQVTPLQPLEARQNIVVQGAYYLQSHLTKSEGGGGHAH
jgi:cobalt-zinc-cadmium efflux system membrane fusion protein